MIWWERYRHMHFVDISSAHLISQRNKMPRRVGIGAFIHYHLFYRLIAIASSQIWWNHCEQFVPFRYSTLKWEKTSSDSIWHSLPLKCRCMRSFVQMKHFLSHLRLHERYESFEFYQRTKHIQHIRCRTMMPWINQSFDISMLDETDTYPMNFF